MGRFGRLSAATLATIDCFIVLGLFGIYLKFALLGRQWGAIARFLGRTAAEDLPLASRAGFFLQDVWLNLLAIPIAAAFVLALGFRRHRSAAAFFLCLILGLVYFVELQVQKQMGQYLTRELVGDLASWTTSNPEMAFDYVSAASLSKLAAYAGVLGAIVAIGRAATRAARSGDEAVARRYKTLLWIPAASAAAVAVLCAVMAVALPRFASPLNRSALASAASMFLNDSSIVVEQGNAHGPFEASRQLTHTDPFDPANGFVGRERNSDAIVFMMETGPAQALDMTTAGRDLPGIGPLYSKAFVASRHYTTHPYSSDALYSVLSGQYPQGRRQVLRQAGSGALHGLMSSLTPAGRMRRVYVPSLYRSALDREMYIAFGAESVYASDENDGDPIRGVAERRADTLIARLEQQGSRLDSRSRARLRARLRADFQALEKAKADMTAAIRADRRYMVLIFPEIGHAPWLPLEAKPGGVLDRGRALMQLQDEWLKEIVDLLGTLGRLDRTVVAVTADHGLRTRTEYPALPVGRISDSMFRVPFLLYAPQTLSSTIAIDEPTSHIDVAPTLLALFGATGSVPRMQGVPVWQRSRKDRIYLLAHAYGGADGLVENGRYFMRQGLSGATFVSDTLLFEDKDQMPSNHPSAAFVDEALRKLDALQHAIAAQVVYAGQE
jgi:sulfatase-like protein